MGPSLGLRRRPNAAAAMFERLTPRRGPTDQTHYSSPVELTVSVALGIGRGTRT
jgi:hypothetical protein